MAQAKPAWTFVRDRRYLALRTGVALAVGSIGPSFARGLLPRSTTDQAMLTGAVGAYALGFSALGLSTVEAVSELIVTSRQGGDPKNVTLAAAGIVAASGGAVVAAVPDTADLALPLAFALALALALALSLALTHAMSLAVVAVPHGSDGLDRHGHRHFARLLEHQREVERFALNELFVEINQHHVQPARLEFGHAARGHVDGLDPAHPHHPVFLDMGVKFGAVAGGA